MHQSTRHFTKSELLAHQQVSSFVSGPWQIASQHKPGAHGKCFQKRQHLPVARRIEKPINEPVPPLVRRLARKTLWLERHACKRKKSASNSIALRLVGSAAPPRPVPPRSAKVLAESSKYQRQAGVVISKRGRVTQARPSWSERIGPFDRVTGFKWRRGKGLATTGIDISARGVIADSLVEIVGQW